MHLLFATFTTALAAPVLIIDDSDSDVAVFRDSLEVDHGHDVTLSSDFGVLEWEFTGDLTAPDGSVLALDDYDVVVWFDGGEAALASMPSEGQEALLAYTNGGGSILLFGQNGYNFRTGDHPLLNPLIPLRSWTYHDGGGSIVCEDDTHPICDGFGLDEITFSGGHLATASVASATSGVRLFGYAPWWGSDHSRVGAAYLSYGLGRALQWGMWGNSGSTSYQSPWWDTDIMTLMSQSVEWLTQGRPPIADAGGPYTGTAGDVYALTGAYSRARGEADIAEYRWDIGSVASIDAPDAVVDFDSSVLDGPVTVTVNLQVEDSDGRTANASTTLFAANADPVVDAVDCPAFLDEGEVGTFAASVSDPETADTLTVEWMLGDGVLGESDTIAVAFANNGTVEVGLTVQDDDGGIAEAACAEPVSVLNVPPTIIGEAPTTVDALSAYRFRPDVEDPGTFDVQTWSIEGPDGATADPSTGEVEWTPTIDDVGDRTMILRVDDGDDDDLYEWTVSVQWPDSDGDGYRFDEDCDDADPTTYPGATELCDAVDSDCDGSITDDYEDLDDDGTPDCIDPDADGDGVEADTDCDDRDATAYPGAPESCDFTDSDCDGSLADEFEDADGDDEPDCIDGDLDGDGMADAWEDAYGLDPDDPDDGGSDIDGDGRTALEEFSTGSDPTAYDGPGAPSVYAPLDGSEVNALPVTLTVVDGDAPLDQALTHSFTVGLSETLDSPFEFVDERGGDPDGTTSATISTDLEENSWVYWTANAQDAFTTGPSMPIAGFFVNLVNEPPGIPGLASPLDGSATDRLELEAIVPADPDLDDVALIFTLELADGSLLVSGELSSETDTVIWSPAVTLVEGDVMCWSATPIDEHGLEGPSSEVACFSIELTNLAPTVPVIQTPESGAVIASLAPTIRVLNGADPEDRTTQHRFEIDTDPTFTSADLQTALVDTDPAGTTEWSVESAFAEDAIVHVRVLCTDGVNNSEWASTQFLVSETNDPPGIPTLLDPADGVPMGEGMPLVTANSVDPEGSAVVHDFKLMDLRDAVIETGDAIEQGDDSTIWVPSALEEGNYQWTARARDADGNASEWAVPRSFVVGTPDQVEEPELGGMIVNGKSEGCSCASGGRGSAQWVWLVGVLAVVAQRRKRLRP